MTMEEGLALVNKVVYDLECEQDIICQPLMKLLAEKAKETYERREADSQQDAFVNMLLIQYQSQALKAN